MVQSMTGFGRAEQTAEGINIAVELKAVNHRYFEFSARLPRSATFLEEKLKSFFQSRISRGKLDSVVSIEGGEAEIAGVEINRAFADPYVAALRELAESYGLKDDVSVSTVARASDVFRIKRATADEEAIWNAVKPVAESALAQFLEMRKREGEKLAADLKNRLATILELVGQIELRSPETVQLYRERLEQKMRELLEGVQIEEQRLLTEVAIFADKVAVDEETVRLRSHIDQFAMLLQEGGPVGRKLDFLVQEMNREANTIGSKAQDLQIARAVVDMKSEIEKIREQIQNVE